MGVDLGPLWLPSKVGGCETLCIPLLAPVVAEYSFSAADLSFTLPGAFRVHLFGRLWRSARARVIGMRSAP